MKTLGVDISLWQGDFNFAKAKNEGIKYAILKAGGADNGLYKDPKYEHNYAEAAKLGIDVGAYFFGIALTPEQAKREAQYFITLLKGKKFAYPVFYDAETAQQMVLGKDKLTAVIKAFCAEVEKAGYWAGFYTNLDFYLNRIHGATLSARYTAWVASWGTKQPSCQMWQFGGNVNYLRSPYVAGVVTDQNYCFTDFPKKIREKGLNGFSKGDKPNLKSVDEIAMEVIQGKWGAGEDRRTRLIDAGYDFNTVQAKVNELLK